MSALKPGDGKTNPFGDGDGDAGMSGSKGNDFVTKPEGSGGKQSGGQPETYGESREQKKGSDDVASDDKAEGPSTAAEAATPANGARDGMIGTSAGTAAHKPFKLSGG